MKKTKTGDPASGKEPHRIVVCSSDEVLDLVETRPKPRRRPKEIKAVRILPDSEKPRLRVDLDALNAAIESIAEPMQVSALDVMPGSKLRRLPDLSALSKLERLRLGAPNVRDWDGLPVSLDSVFHLRMWGHACDSLERFDDCEFEFLELVKGRVESFARSSRYVELVRCNELLGFAECSIEILQLEACNHSDLDLASLASVRGLRSLRLRSMKKLSSLSFIQECSDLDELIIEAGRYSTLEMSALEEIERPFRASLYGLSEMKKKALLDRNPNLTFDV